MIKENKYDTIIEAEDYDKLLKKIREMQGKYVVLLKDMPCEINGRECTISQGSLARIDTISMAGAGYSKDNRDCCIYIENIYIEFLKDREDGDVYIKSVKVWEEENAKDFTKDEDCLYNISTALQYLNDNFGITPQIEKIGKKISKRERIIQGRLWGTVIIAILGLITLILCKSVHTNTAIGMVELSLTIFTLIGFGFGIGFTISKVLEIANTGYKSKKRLWVKYDKLITDMAENINANNQHYMEIEKLLTVNNKDNIINIVDIAHKPKDKDRKIQ